MSCAVRVLAPKPIADFENRAADKSDSFDVELPIDLYALRLGHDSYELIDLHVVRAIVKLNLNFAMISL